MTGSHVGPLWLLLTSGNGVPGRSPWKEPIKVVYGGRWGLSISAESSVLLTLAFSQALLMRGQAKPQIQGWSDTWPFTARLHLWPSVDQTRWWFSLLSSPGAFTSSWKTGFLAPLVSKAVLGLCQVFTKPWACGLLSMSGSPWALSQPSNLSWQ